MELKYAEEMIMGKSLKLGSWRGGLSLVPQVIRGLPILMCLIRLLKIPVQHLSRQIHVDKSFHFTMKN